MRQEGSRVVQEDTGRGLVASLQDALMVKFDVRGLMITHDDVEDASNVNGITAETGLGNLNEETFLGAQMSRETYFNTPHKRSMLATCWWGMCGVVRNAVGFLGDAPMPASMRETRMPDQELLEL